MDFNRPELSLPQDAIETLEKLYRAAANINPVLTREVFMESIIKEWLDLYRRTSDVLPKDKVNLKNNLKQAIELSGKSQAQVAREIGVNRSYLGQVVRGNYEPSVTLALLILQSINYPAEKLKDVFLLEPVDKE